MIRNDYRRALIMLRSLANGYSGHARIEVRTLAGTLSALASIPQGDRSVYAALVGSHRGKYYAAPLGIFRRDMRGQGVMSVNFDPRDIGGRPLEAYGLLTLVEVTGGKQDIAMVGNLNGNVDVDWGRAKDAACALYRAEAVPVSELLSEKTELESEMLPDDQEKIIWDLTPAPDVREEVQEEIREEIREEVQEEELQELPLVEEETPEPEEDVLPEVEVPPEVEIIPEPEESEPPMEGEGWSFVKIPMVKGCGFDCSYIGVRSACTPDAICYALPACFTPEPPPGLDEYEWVGDNRSGWWIYCETPSE